MRFWRLFKWLEESSERKEYKGLPRGGWYCEALGISRRPKEEGWKCYKGCLIMKNNKKTNNNFIKNVIIYLTLKNLMI